MIKVYLNPLEVSIIFFAISKVLHLEQLHCSVFVQNTGIVSNYTKKYSAVSFLLSFHQKC